MKTPIRVVTEMASTRNLMISEFYVLEKESKLKPFNLFGFVLYGEVKRPLLKAVFFT